MKPNLRNLFKAVACIVVACVAVTITTTLWPNSHDASFFAGSLVGFLAAVACACVLPIQLNLSELDRKEGEK